MENANGPSTGSVGIRGKDDEKKLFVGGLPKGCEEKELWEAFSKFGPIESINIKKNPLTKASRGFCFIVFSDKEIVDKILESGDILINKKKVTPKKVTKSTIPGKIFIGGLTSDFTEEKIREHFGQYGNVMEIEWPIDRQKNQKRAYCFITFENRETVAKLLKTPKMEVCGKVLDVKKVKTNPETMWQHGGMMGTYARGLRDPYDPAYEMAYAYAGYGYEYPPMDYGGYDDCYEGYHMYGDAYVQRFRSVSCNAHDYYYEEYGYEYPSMEYAGYDDFTKDTRCMAMPAYDAFEAYPAAYTTRAPRGGRTVGGYARHAPY